jgi:glyoxylase-like metal-dependent hydrolase (beta-lactamase superfamily II)
VRRERVADGVYAFISDMYAQVNCGVILTEKGAVVIDTLPFPQETRQMLRFIYEQLGPDSVRYVINTQSHADHINGTYLFGGATVIAHENCRVALETWGAESLEKAKRTVMPVPYIRWGDWREYRESLSRMRLLKADVVVQGHGEVLLRGEMRESVDSSIEYLDHINALVTDLVNEGATEEEVEQVDIESCGKSRIPLHGLVIQLHRDNLSYLYRTLQEQRVAFP